MKPLLDHIDASSNGMIARLLQWSAINSGTFNRIGLESMLEQLRTEFAPLGAIESIHELSDVEQIDDAGKITRKPLGRAVRFVKRPDAKRRVLLNIHYDTVYDVDSPSQSPTQTDADTITGPGVADAKGGIVVMLAALSALESETPEDELADFGWEVLLNPDEEIGSPGSAGLLRDSAARNQSALLFEPTLPDGSLVGARKGSGSFTVIVHGKAAHSGRDFAAGRNAIVALAEFVTQIEAEARSLGPGVIINCGKITGGGHAINIVPDLAIARFNVRVDTLNEMSRVETTFNSFAQQFGQRDGFRVELHGGFASPPKPVDAGARQLFDLALRCAREVGLGHLDIHPTGGTCDGNKLAAAGIPVIDTLGPVGGEIHSTREFVRVSSLAERAKMVAMMLSELAGRR